MRTYNVALPEMAIVAGTRAMAGAGAGLLLSSYLAPDTRRTLGWTLLAIGAPVILLIGGLRAFFRTYQTWRNRETWWAWQGAGWFLFTLMLVVLTMSMPALAGPALLGG